MVFSTWITVVIPEIPAKLVIVCLMVSSIGITVIAISIGLSCLILKGKKKVPR